MDKEIFIVGDFFEEFQLETFEKLQKKHDMEYIRRINEKHLTKKQKNSEDETSNT